MTAETRRRREKYFNHGWTRMDTDKKAEEVDANGANLATKERKELKDKWLCGEVD